MQQFTSRTKANQAASRLTRAGHTVVMSRERSFRTSGFVYFVYTVTAPIPALKGIVR